MWLQNIFKNKPVIDTDSAKIEEILSRGVEDILVKDSLEKKLKSGKQLRIKLGFDPTGDKIHIGRAVLLRKLRSFQELGHKAVFLVGDMTATIGDPSDKLEKRPMLSPEKISENLKSYKKQVGKIVDLSKAEFHYNSKWLSKLKFREIIELSESFSVLQMSNRRNFKERLEKGEEVSLREFLYPLLQGYDSVALDSDIELGGFDQLFNLKAGRIVQKHYNKPEQDILTTQMLEGTDGRKMSTSWGNVINIIDSPGEMYGKVMSLRDELITKYFLLATNISEVYIKEVEEKLKRGDNPKELKMELAREIVELYHSKEAALKAQAEFASVFSLGKTPTDIQEVSVQEGAELRAILVDLTLVPSKSEFVRLVNQGAIFNMTTGEKVEEILEKITETAVYKIGKKQFIKINVKNPA